MGSYGGCGGGDEGCGSVRGGGFHCHRYCKNCKVDTHCKINFEQFKISGYYEKITCVISGNINSG